MQLLVVLAGLALCLAATATASAGGENSTLEVTTSNRHDGIGRHGPGRDAKWITHGQGLQNWRNQVVEDRITAATAPGLRLRWVFETLGNDTTATPSIADHVIYFPSWDGYLYAVQADTGALIWSRLVADLTGIEGTLSRATPVIYESVLLVDILGPAAVVCVDRASGNLLWVTVLPDEPLAQITMSGTPFEGHYYVGVSSNQEQAQVPPNCCTFIGSMVKMDIATGAVVWRTYMLPPNNGQQGLYSGAAIWGSSPAIDRHRRQVYIATGNLYSAPESVEQCEAEQQALPEPEVPDPCIEPENRANAVVALDLDTGAFRWWRVLGGYSAWTYACLTPGNPNCPPGPGTDYDFGAAPVIVTVTELERELVVVGQKSGTVWALDPDAGDVVWGTVAGPGGVVGGSIWGSCTDGERFFTNIANSDVVPWTLVPSGEVVLSGGWAALELATGEVLWSTADPLGSRAWGPPSCANDVVFVTSAAPEGSVFALSAQTGDVVWSGDEPDASIYGGYSIAYGCVYFGEGYDRPALGTTPGNKVFAYCL